MKSPHLGTTPKNHPESPETTPPPDELKRQLEALHSVVAVLHRRALMTSLALEQLVELMPEDGTAEILSAITFRLNAGIESCEPTLRSLDLFWERDHE